MAANKYRATCSTCGEPVLPEQGICYRQGRRWVVLHIPCANQSSKPAARPAVNTIKLRGQYGTQTFYRNAAGKCEDAPCCGCCTI